MKGLLWLLTLAALAVGVALSAHFNDAYLLLIVPPYRAEVSLNLVVVLLVGAFVTLYAVLRAVALTLALPRRAREYRERRRREKLAGGLADAMRLVFEGRYGHALDKAGEAYAAGQSPALAALLAAYSAQCLRQRAKQQLWLGRAVDADATMQSAALMLEAQMGLDVRDYAAARQALARLQRTAGRRIAALRLELRAAQGSADWPEALRLARLLESRHALSAEDAAAIRRQAGEALPGRRSDPVARR